VRADDASQALPTIAYPAWVRYSVAVVLTTAITAGAHALKPVSDLSWRHPYLIGWPTVIAAAWFGGLGPGLVATALCGGGILLLWTEPVGSLRSALPSDLVALGLFAFCGVVVSALIHNLHRARAGERQLRRSREIVLGIVAHDLRNPLGAIALSSQVLRRRPTDVKRLDAIERAARRMDRLIGDLLDASVLDNNMSLSVIVADEDVAPLVADAVAAVTSDATLKGISLVTEMTPDLRASCDRERILQVLGNLLGNAVKFTPEGGRVTVRAVTSESFVRVEVSDSGPSIKPDHQQFVFERNWTSGGKAGAGLGLFIARGIVRAHGGRLWVHSEPGHGTTFFLTVPAARSHPVTSPPPVDSKRLLLS
jgi:signal transduction histidine kinase